VTIRPDPKSQLISNLPRWARIVDYIVFALLALSLYIFLFGGIRIFRWGVLFRVTDLGRLFWEITALAAVRHFFVRRPHVLQHATEIGTRLIRDPTLLWKRVPDWLREAAPVAALSIATRVAVLCVGLMAVILVGYPPAGPDWYASTDAVGNLPARWDSGWYLGIAQHGYGWDPNNKGQQNLAFFPSYPAAMRLMSRLMWNDVTDPSRLLWAGVTVSVLTFIPALMYMFFLARDQIGEDGAMAACVLLSAYPFAVFFSGAYTESLFLLTVVGAFYHFTHGQLWRAAGWGLLAGLTRPNGWIVSASLGLIALPSLGGFFTSLSRFLPPSDRSSAAGRLAGRNPIALLLAASAPGLGLLLYCGYNYWLTGHPFTWARVMVSWGRDFHGLEMINWELDSLTSSGLVGYIRRTPLGALNFFGLAFGIVTIWPVAKRLGLAYGVFVLATTALPALSGGLISIGRYTSVLFPSFIWLSARSSRSTRQAIILLFAIFQGLAAILFFTWRELY